MHGLIVFEADGVDDLAWKLLHTPELQRLRRIRQLGMSEFTFPGATHSRFAHSIGVFHGARQLVKVIERELHRGGQAFDSERASTAMLAALLHDIGHGPFSHAFEGISKDRAVTKRHEQWTAELIRNPKGGIVKVLGQDEAEAIAALLEREDPEDIYHAVVSSAFDADRLDYLRRDRRMTGTGAGAIDLDWLMDNLCVATINTIPVGEEGEIPVQTFCFATKALPAAEQFLLARYTLYEQVYFHKTTRCIEKMIGKLLGRIAAIAQENKGVVKRSGLPRNHPLVRFFARDGESPETYLALDDTVIYGALSLLADAEDTAVRNLALRLRDRQPYKTYDLAEVGSDSGVQARTKRRIEEVFRDKLDNGAIIKDEAAAVSIYTQIGGDEEKMHKRLHVFDGNVVKEISKISPLVNVLQQKTFTRFYCENEADRDAMRKL